MRFVNQNFVLISSMHFILDLTTPMNLLNNIIYEVDCVVVCLYVPCSVVTIPSVWKFWIEIHISSNTLCSVTDRRTWRWCQFADSTSQILYSGGDDGLCKVPVVAVYTRLFTGWREGGFMWRSLFHAKNIECKNCRLLWRFIHACAHIPMQVHTHLVCVHMQTCVCKL